MQSISWGGEYVFKFWNQNEYTPFLGSISNKKKVLFFLGFLVMENAYEQQRSKRFLGLNSQWVQHANSYLKEVESLWWSSSTLDSYFMCLASICIMNWSFGGNEKLFGISNSFYWCEQIESCLLCHLSYFDYTRNFDFVNVNE